MNRALILWLLCVTVTLAAADAPRHYWSRGIPAAPLKGPQDPARPRFYVILIRGDGDSLKADGTYDNYTRDGETTHSVRLDGWLDGGWMCPDATLEVGPDSEGPWRSVGPAPTGKKRTSVVVRPGKQYDVRVDISPFQKFLDAARWGRIVLHTGHSVIIDFRDLSPP